MSCTTCRQFCILSVQSSGTSEIAVEGVCSVFFVFFNQVLSTILKELPKADGVESFATDLLTVTSSLLLHSSDRLSVEMTARLVALVSAVC